MERCQNCGRKQSLIGAYCLKCTIKIEGTIKGHSINEVCESWDFFRHEGYVQEYRQGKNKLTHLHGSV